MQKDGISVSGIPDVLDGPTTAIFATSAGWFRHADCCFSLVSAGRTLDLEAATVAEKTEWVLAFLCLKRYRSTI